MWVGIGCGGLFLLSTIGGIVAFVMAKRATDQIAAAVTAAAGGAAGASAPGATPGTTDDTKPADGATDSAGGPVNGACAKAAECCRKIVQKSNAGAQAEAGCLAMKQLTEATCVQPLQTYQQSAKLLGVNCD
jgi:hypothetical protein